MFDLKKLVVTFSLGAILGWITESYLIGGGLASVVVNRLNKRWPISFMEGAAGAALGRYFRVREQIEVTTLGALNLVEREVRGE